MSTARTVAASRIEIAQLMHPEHANNIGNVHGGWIMKLVDEAGALTCMRHAAQRVVTVAVDQMTFRHPILIGDLVTIRAEVSWVGRTSMEAEVQVLAENPIAGILTQTLTNTAYLVYVALDEHGKPVGVPDLHAETPEQIARMEDGKRRQDYRVKGRSA